ncbi:MAG: hypothetical protein AB7I34_24605 [Rhizobiaceae bacterium]
MLKALWFICALCAGLVAMYYGAYNVEKIRWNFTPDKRAGLGYQIYFGLMFLAVLIFIADIMTASG